MASEMVKAATSDKLKEMDWAKNIEICELVAQDPGKAKDVIKSIKKCIGGRNKDTQLYAVMLLEMLMNNCGEPIHRQVIDNGLLPILVKIVKKKTELPVREKIFLLLDATQTSLGGAKARFPQYYDAYYELVSAGVQFSNRPNVVVTRAEVPVLETRTLPNKETLSTRLNEAQQEVHAQPAPDTSIVRKASSVMEVLRDVLNAMNPRHPEGATDEFVLDLVEQCTFQKQRIMHLVMTSRDEAVVSQAIELNEELHKVLVRHDALLSVQPTTTVASNLEEKEEEDAESLYRRLRKGKALSQDYTDDSVPSFRSIPDDKMRRPLTIQPPHPDKKLGCIKFLESYYLILVTKRRQIGCICGHAIYCIDESQMITIPHSSVQTDVATSKNELRYKKLLASVDLTKDFFYSYTYPIMQSLQQNVTSAGIKEMPYENLFVWNTFLTEPIRSRCRNTLWTVALVHGHFKQVRLSIFGRDINVVLISRRSRHFAGTRYLKRGVNDHGKVANDVETEQIVFEEEAGSLKGRMSAVVQMRGSIPLFWSQEASRLSPKPDIFVQRYDPTYEATKLHFDDLAQRYGHPIIILNLIKTVEKRPREMMLRREYFNAVGYLNQNVPEEKKLRFIHWDFHKFAKSKSANVLGVLGKVAGEALDLTGFCYSGKPKVQKKRSTQLSRTSTARDGSLDIRVGSGDLSRLSSNADALSSTGFQDMRKEANKQEPLGDAPCYQTGVLRTNCIDCLDRTNVAQYAYGLAALGRQLHAMGLTHVPKIHPDSSIASALMEMYQSMGDALAHQYGGSAAHNTVFTERQGKWKATTQSREFLKSIKRYYSNAYTDGEKQDAINLFLGYFQPQEGKPALWELDTDYYLHVTTAGDDLMSNSYPSSSAPGNNAFMGSGAALNLGTTLRPVPACKEDYSKMKLTSFEKLIGMTCSSIKDVRLHCDADLKLNGGVGTSGMAPDAAEIQLKSPNWLFGQRKHTETIPSKRVAPVENVNEGNKDEANASLCGELNWLSSSSESCEEDIFRRYLAFTTADVENGWYGGTLIYDQDENSGAYKHYSELCQGAVMDPFEHDPENERHYTEALSVDLDISNDARVEAEMQAALDDYQIIGSDLSIIPSCCSLAEDPSHLTRWIIGDEKLRVGTAQ